MNSERISNQIINEDGEFPSLQYRKFRRVDGKAHIILATDPV